MLGVVFWVESEGEDVILVVLFSIESCDCSVTIEFFPKCSHYLFLFALMKNLPSVHHCRTHRAITSVSPFEEVILYT